MEPLGVIILGMARRGRKEETTAKGGNGHPGLAAPISRTSATTGDVPPRAEAATAAPSAPVPEVQPIPQAPLLFEVAWEVCWQLGGIYTVLRTKAASMIERWGDRYCLIGPYNPSTAAVEFEDQPTYGSIRETIQRLKEN